MEQEHTANIVIQEASPVDVVEARIMLAKSWLATYPNDETGVSHEWVKDKTDKWLTPERLERSKQNVLEARNDPSQYYRVALKNDQVIGMIHVALQDGGTKDIEALYVHPDHIGEGVGQKLMDEADRWIGLDTAHLQVATYNVRAIKFYEKNGFKVVHGTEELYIDKIPVVTMERRGDKS